MTDVLDLAEVGLSEARKRVGHALRSGEIVVAPTDTVYGVLADVTNEQAVERLFAARATTRTVPPAVLVHNARNTWAVAEDVPTAAERLMAAFWPGPLTLVLRARGGIDWHLGERRETVGIRMPAEALLMQVGYDVGALACSAASRAGDPPPTTLTEARERLGDAVALYVEDGPRDASPSTVVDLTRGGAEVLREGAISAEDIAVAAEDPDQEPVAERGEEKGGETEK